MTSGLAPSNASGRITEESDVFSPQACASASPHEDWATPWEEGLAHSKLLGVGICYQPVFSTSDRSVVLSWSGLRVFVCEKRTSRRRKLSTRFTNGGADEITILKDCYGLAQPGRLLAIMGASGAGKSTLLNTLTYRGKANMTVRGHVLVNGISIGKEIRATSAYVCQDDLFIGTLTVKEHLFIQARLRLERTLTDRDREARVEEVMEQLGLKKCAFNTIGVPGRVKGISGGERKRLSFASEVLTDPPLLFCDEFTSGLDSFMALQVVKMLKHLANIGKTVVCTVHQPSSQVFAYFDDLCLLADGRTVYFGPCSEAATFFASLNYPCPANFNPSDHYIKILASTPGQEALWAQDLNRIAQKFMKEETYSKLKFQIDSLTRDHRRSLSKKFLMKHNVGWWMQFRTLLWRSYLHSLRDPLLLKIRLYQNIIIPVIIGLLYWQATLQRPSIANVNGILFLLANNMVFGFVFGVIEVFCIELPVFVRERQSNICRVDTYYLSKTLVEIPQYIVYPSIFTTIVYWMTGLYPTISAFITALLSAVLCANAAVSLGYVISTMFANVEYALAVSPLIIIPGLLFGGFYVNQQTVPIYFDWLKYLSIFRYTYEALAINQWCRIDIFPQGENATGQYSGADILHSIGMREQNFQTDLFSLIGMIMLFRLISYLFLVIRVYLYYS